jgi:tetraacyldisaccharide 4'-kinase
MKLNKPKFWGEKNNLISILLLPFTYIILLVILFKKKLTKKIRFNIPIICVGNIYIGGTGKTPTSIFLAHELLAQGKNPTILRKYYKIHDDEHKLIRKSFNNLILHKNRVKGIEEAVKKNYDCLIMDDGFQDYRIKKDLSILCFHQNQLVGNGLVLPSGPLRENLNSLNDANIILINGKKNIEFEKKVLNINKNLEIFYSCYKPLNINKFENKKLLAVAGIGNPENFFQLLIENNLNVEKKLIFPDHYDFTKKEIQTIVDEAKINGYQVITTEKNYIKIKNFKIDGFDYLKVTLDIYDKNKFIKTIKKFYDKKN